MKDEKPEVKKPIVVHISEGYIPYDYFSLPMKCTNCDGKCKVAFPKGTIVSLRTDKENMECPTCGVNGMLEKF